MAVKVGDKVQVTADGTGPNVETGQIVKIMQINGRNFCRVEWSPGFESDKWEDTLTVVEPR